MWWLCGLHLYKPHEELTSVQVAVTLRSGSEIRFLEKQVRPLRSGNHSGRTRPGACTPTPPPALLIPSNCLSFCNIDPPWPSYLPGSLHGVCPLASPHPSENPPVPQQPGFVSPTSWGACSGREEGLPPMISAGFNSVQLLSRVRLFATPWTAARQASLSITISQSLLKLMSIESVMPSNHLILCHPLLLLLSIFPNIRVFSNESILCIRWPKYWSSSFSVSPSSDYSGLISFRMGWLDLLAVQGTLKILFQHHSSKASILRRWVDIW